MAYDRINKKLYVTEGGGLTLPEVAECLQDPRTNNRGQKDLGLLCTSPNINKWSKNKPFIVADGVNISGVQSDEARRTSAYGFYWWNRVAQGALAPFGRSYHECMDKALLYAGDWNYQKPTNVFRLRDFDGYSHLATRPYIYDMNSPNLGKNIYCRVLRDPGDNTSEILLSDMPDFTGDFDCFVKNLKLVIIYRSVGSNVTRVLFTPYTVKDLDDYITTSPQNLVMPSLSGAVYRDWNIIYAATNASSESVVDDVFYFYLPGSLMTYRQREALSWEYCSVNIYGETFLGIVPTDGLGNVLTNPSDFVSSIYFGISIKNMMDNTIDWRIQVLAWNEDEGETIDDAFSIYTSSGRVASGDTILFEDAGDSLEISLIDIVNATLDHTSIAVNFFYKDVKNSQYTAKHLDLIQGGVVDYEAEDGVTLHDLIRYANVGQPIKI